MSAAGDWLRQWQAERATREVSMVLQNFARDHLPRLTRANDLVLGAAGQAPIQRESLAAARCRATADCVH
jgi:hypothetical protein